VDFTPGRSGLNSDYGDETTAISFSYSSETPQTSPSALVSPSTHISTSSTHQGLHPNDAELPRCHDFINRQDPLKEIPRQSPRGESHKLHPHRTPRNCRRSDLLRKRALNTIRGLRPRRLYANLPFWLIQLTERVSAPVRQRRPFFYFSGCSLTDSYATYHIASKKLTLYIPPTDPASVLWSGLPLSPEQAKDRFDVDRVLTTSELDREIRSFSATPAQPIFIIPTQVSRDVITRQQVAGSVQAEILKEAVDECRVTKDEYEIALIKRANLISERAHHAAMAAVKTAKNERELMAVFTQQCIASGAPTQAYSGIFGSGRAAATLHYVHNDQPLGGKLNLLLDAGAEQDSYASDVTRTFPISGEFSKESRQIYDIVLKMQKDCLAQCRAGKNWDEVHVLAHRVAIEGLLEIGVLKGGSVEEILRARTSCAFLPHGLGHYLGMDTHDTGGHPNYEDKDKMFCYLRKRGPLDKGAVITVEPGVYFCQFIIRPYLEDPKHNKYIDEKILEKYWDVGGVRIEDNILITEDGHKNLTTAVKEVEDMYKIINPS